MEGFCGSEAFLRSVELCDIKVKGIKFFFFFFFQGSRISTGDGPESVLATFLTEQTGLDGRQSGLSKDTYNGQLN
jgi:hypothetical protein